ncbi:MAG: GNAT family N-acetyltransferase [Pseudomonadota bacterium]
MQIRIDDLRGPEIAALLQEHLADMHATSPRESVHALDLDALRQPEITFWTVWDGAALAGCGALKQHDARHAEIKSMRVAHPYRRQGVAAELMRHLLAVAAERGYARLSLETGSQAFFEPARKLYASHGFTVCGPFADYRLDPNSVFMSKTL